MIDLLHGLSFLAGLAGGIWCRPAVRAAARTLLAFLKRRARLARRSLAALSRAAHLRPHRPRHATPRTHP
ncbi:hypothetical protein [Nonomuraea rhodomycinica]|uniref:Uncharacterized protein n=1 Tax=Nonomuraea rhodomycinica TaxID=1712872 RepID=A0A7Y6MG69_9ACTN|nr:hypothetical protein [Nonomuraea rhodomycinica]NUW45589.1 hypothetical protein [Nonomuraea rhodomycinica]